MFSSRPITERKFKASFGVDPLLIDKIWASCQVGMLAERIKQKHLLWTLYWMMVCPTEDAAMTVFGIGSRNTRQKTWPRFWRS